MRHQVGHTVAKFGADLLDGHRGILHCIVQNGCRKHLGVVGDGGYDAGCFHAMDDIGIALATAFGATMGLCGEEGCTVEKPGIERVVHVTESD